MRRATLEAAALATPALLLLSVGPAGSPLLLTGVAGAGSRLPSRAGAPDAVYFPGRVTKVAAGLYHSLALTSNGTAFGWGWNITGQLCNGNTTGSDTPDKETLLGGKRLVGIAAGFAHSLFLSSGGGVFSCGKNDDGELGDGNTTDSDTPMKVELPPGTKVTAVAASEHSLAVTSAGTLLSWGSNLFGELGNGGTAASDVPVKVDLPPGTKVTAAAAGSIHSLALTSSGAVFAWGFNADGELGDGATTNSDVPVKVDLPAGTKVVAIAAGGFDSLALTSTGAVYAWGYNGDGELGDGGKANSDVPVKVDLPPGTKVKAIAAGGPLLGVGSYVAGPGHSLALTFTGAVYAWGYNADGQLGDGTTANSGVPVRVKLSGRKVTAIAAGQIDSLAVTTSGSVLAWGGNNFGQLGDGSYKPSDLPLQVSFAAHRAGLRATAGPERAAAAQTPPPTVTQSNTFAGYNFANYIGVPGAVSAVLVVPSLRCKATPAAGSAIYAGAGIASVNSYARLYLACAAPGVARYYPSLLVNGAIKNFASHAVHPGDRVEVAVSQSVSQVTVTVIDLTRNFVVTANGSGSGTSEGVTAGVYSFGSGEAVPNFGTLAFSSAQTNGYPLGSAVPGLQVDKLYAGSTLQVKTTYSTTDHELFATVFEHS